MPSDFGLPQRLPPPLMTSEPGSFARKTIAERKAQIIARVIADNPYPEHVVAQLAAFQDEIMQPALGSSVIQPLHERSADAAFWNQSLAAYAGRTWLDVPWYFAETYFYRRLLGATGYFDAGSPAYGKDPFAPQKRVQEASAVRQLNDVLPALYELPETGRFEALLHGCLWGNRADLSNFTVAQRALADAIADRHNILVDHTEALRRLLTDGVTEVAFVNDNVGADSLFDLVLADHLLVQGRASRVTFHLKNQPFFVSDAMPSDVLSMVNLLGAPRICDKLAGLADRLAAHLAEGNLVLTSHPFWTQCLHFRQMPDALRSPLQRADLVILKGDVNYRRLLDDRHWPPTTPLSVAAGAFPRPFLVLRTLKGEIIAGLAPGQAEALTIEDPSWLINGQRGLIHLVHPPPTSSRESHGPSPIQQRRSRL